MDPSTDNVRRIAGSPPATLMLLRDRDRIVEVNGHAYVTELDMYELEPHSYSARKLPADAVGTSPLRRSRLAHIESLIVGGPGQQQLLMLFGTILGESPEVTTYVRFEQESEKVVAMPQLTQRVWAYAWDGRYEWLATESGLLKCDPGAVVVRQRHRARRCELLAAVPGGRTLWVSSGLRSARTRSVDQPMEPSASLARTGEHRRH